MPVAFKGLKGLKGSGGALVRTMLNGMEQSCCTDNNYLILRLKYREAMPLFPVSVTKCESHFL